jgi:hypothetical protein
LWAGEGRRCPYAGVNGTSTAQSPKPSGFGRRRAGEGGELGQGDAGGEGAPARLVGREGLAGLGDRPLPQHAGRAVAGCAVVEQPPHDDDVVDPVEHDGRGAFGRHGLGHGVAVGGEEGGEVVGLDGVVVHAALRPRLGEHVAESLVLFGADDRAVQQRRAEVEPGLVVAGEDSERVAVGGPVPGGERRRRRLDAPVAVIFAGVLLAELGDEGPAERGQRVLERVGGGAAGDGDDVHRRSPGLERSGACRGGGGGWQRGRRGEAPYR